MKDVKNRWVYKLQPLRIPLGWQIDINIFFEIDPSEETIRWFSGSCLLSMTNTITRKSLTLSYSPEGDVNGYFCLTLLRITGETKISRKKSCSELEVIREFQSRSRLEIVKEIEDFLDPFTE